MKIPGHISVAENGTGKCKCKLRGVALGWSQKCHSDHSAVGTSPCICECPEIDLLLKLNSQKPEVRSNSRLGLTVATCRGGWNPPPVLKVLRVPTELWHCWGNSSTPAPQQNCLNHRVELWELLPFIEKWHKWKWMFGGTGGRKTELILNLLAGHISTH